MMPMCGCSTSRGIELNGDDMRRDPLAVCKASLASIVAKASPGIGFNEYMEGDGPTVFAHALQAWPRRHRLEAQGFHLSFRPVTRLAQDEECRCTGLEARSRGRLVEMTRRKREIVGLAN